MGERLNDSEKNKWFSWLWPRKDFKNLPLQQLEMWLVKINKNLHTLALLILDKDHKSVTRNYHGFFTNQQKYAPLPKKKKKKSVRAMCLEFHINTPLKIYRNCVWFLSNSSRGYITTSKRVYCLKINSVDRKPMWDKHGPYVLVLHFRRVSILMWLHIANCQFSLIILYSASWGRMEIGWTEYVY